MTQNDYEFSPGENETIGQAALWARVLGAVLIVDALARIRNISNGIVVVLLSIIVGLLVGMAFFAGGNALKRVVDTEGNDIQHTMEAMRQLTKAFRIRIAVVVAVCVLLVLGMMAGACLTMAAF